MSKALFHTVDLAPVEEIILSKFASEAPILAEVSRYLHSLGGKRVRPCLTLLTAEAFGLTRPYEQTENGRQLLQVAAGIELIHLATLLHDDIIDKSPRRRHKDSPWLRFGLEPSLLTGDFLLTRAFGICGLLDDFIIRATEQACVALTEGEVLELPLFKKEFSEAEALTIARKKTAALFRLATESAGYLAGLRGSDLEAIASFGINLGTAFQIVDDILDVAADEKTLGKKNGQDLREAKPSLVNVMWMQGGSSLAKRLLSPLAPEEQDRYAQDAIAEILSTDVPARCRKVAAGLVDQAREDLRAASGSRKADTRHLDAVLSFIQERAY